MQTKLKNAASLRRDWTELAGQTLAIEMEGLRAVREALGPSFNQAVEFLAACRGRVVISGLGKSGLVGRKIAATLSSTGTPAFFMHPVEGQHGDLGSIREDDALIAISNSGETDELNALLPPLRVLGVKIIALTGGAASTLAGLADLTISTAVPREACPLNLAPTSSTTATLAVGDALAVCLIEARGFTEKDFRRVHPGGALGRRLSRPVLELMRRDAPLADQQARLDEALAALHRGGLGAVFLVNGQGAVSGVITDGDLRRSLLNKGFDPARRAEELMTRSFRSAAPEDTAAEALNRMEDAAITVMPILDKEGRALGVIHLHDLLGKGGIRFSAGS